MSGPCRPASSWVASRLPARLTQRPRASPTSNSTTSACSPLLRPWLVLVVGTTGQEVIVDGATVRILNSALVAHPLVNSAGWAHVHAIPGATIARILSPRQLAANTAYPAV